MPETAAVLVLLAFLLWTLAPLVLAGGASDDAAPSTAAPTPAAEAAAEREHVLVSLRDADLDLAMGKLTTADHSAIKTELESRAIALLATEEAETAGENGSTRPS